MSEYRNKEYIESMSLIKLSDDKKEKMISDLTKISPIRKEGTMKKRMGVKKTAIIVAACIMVFGVTAAASGIATGVVSHNKIEPEPEPVVEPEPEKEPVNVTGIMAIILILALGGVGGFMYYTSTKNSKKKSGGVDPDQDYTDEDYLKSMSDDGDEIDLDVEQERIDEASESGGDE